MKRTALLVVVLAFMVVLNGCLYSNVMIPLDIDADKTVIGSKVGTSICQSVLWLVAWGDASAEAAAKNGNITVINHMDREVFSILLACTAKVRQ